MTGCKGGDIKGSEGGGHRAQSGGIEGGLARSEEMREHDEEEKVSGQRKERMTQGQTGSSRGGGDDASKGLCC